MTPAPRANCPVCNTMQVLLSNGEISCHFSAKDTLEIDHNGDARGGAQRTYCIGWHMLPTDTYIQPVCRQVRVGEKDDVYLRKEDVARLLRALGDGISSGGDVNYDDILELADKLEGNKQ